MSVVLAWKSARKSNEKLVDQKWPYYLGCPLVLKSKLVKCPQSQIRIHVFCSCRYNASIFATLALCKSLAIKIPAEEDEMEDHPRFLQYFRAWLRLQSCENRCPQPSLISFLEEFGANDQAVRRTVQEARLFFQLTANCPFFSFMKPSAVTRTGRRACQTCKNDGFNRSDPVATYQTFDITLPKVPERDESLASLVRGHFNNAIDRNCANCNSIVTTTNSTYLVNAQRAVVINLLRFNNNPNWRGNMTVGQGEGLAALKNKRRVDLAGDIVIPGYNVGIGESYTYQLVSTCEHIGDDFFQNLFLEGK